ncbi:MAG TPA: DUF1553 domain-containing protein, partial [Bryobacteraceae bacterium]|nr:DUF1553 domain-containing protein [Bryobacteraceae bacterium]
GALAWQYQQPLAARSNNGAILRIFNEELVDYNFYLRGSLVSERKPGSGLIIASGHNPEQETYTVQFKPGKGTWTALGVDVHQDESLPGNRLSRGADRFVVTEVNADVAAPGQPARKLVFLLATSTGFGQPLEHPAMAAIDGDAKTGWGVAFGEHRNAFLALRLKEKVTTGPDDVVTLQLHQNSEFRRATIGRFRVALSAGEHSWPELGDSNRKSVALKEMKEEIATLAVPSERGLPPEVLKALETDESDRTDEQRKIVLDHYAWSAPELQKDTLHIATLEAERSLLDAQIPRVLVTERVRPRVTRVLPRGNFLDESGEIVEPAVPQFLGKVGTPGQRLTRLDLANWIVSKDNPLTARVFVNRTWRQFFGTGLSKVLEDLGSQGELPVHLELLDWLAAEFMQPESAGQQPWNVRHLMRTIVTSHTYRQSSLPTRQAEDRDPDNRLLARQSRFRVDAEFVHDSALSVAGLLHERFGGPSVRPYQPEGYLAAMNFPKREYSASHGDDLHRRALYIQWQRTFLHPTLATFDAPSREECTVNRVSSNTPLQSLVLLNDPIFVEAARVFGQGAMAAGKTFDERLTWAFERALGRTPDKDERRILAGLYQRSLASFRKEGAPDFLKIGEAPLSGATTPELAAMATVTRAILNLHETITRN